MGDERLRSCLGEHWGLGGATVRAHHGGMNSATWFVTAGGERWVAKAVAAGERRSFVGGLAVAGHVEAAGIPAGAPVPTRRGDLVADLDGAPLALLSWVGGDELTGSDQRLLGRTLGRVHEAQADYFARRLVTGDLTGIAGTAGNLKGLADAHRGLLRSDV
jgi:Ser/Thr protein kinase RdoA (MazF antagonist)